VKSCRSAGVASWPSRFDGVINLKATKILGLEFFPSLIGGADEVIE
jgi:hypothetical protein